MIEYISTHEAADKWGLLQDVFNYCVLKGALKEQLKSFCLAYSSRCRETFRWTSWAKATRKKDDIVLNGGIDCERHY